MSSDKKCCVPGCFEANSGASAHSVLHIFPNPMKDPERFQAWRLFVGGHILELSDQHIYKYRRICHAHFEEKFHCRYNRLSNIAIPTLNLTDKQIIDVGKIKENDPASQTTSGYICKPSRSPMSSIKNVIGSVLTTSKDKQIMDVENMKENNPAPQTTSSYICKPSKSTLSSIENVIGSLPTTSKEMISDTLGISKPNYQKDNPAVESKKTRKTVKVSARTLAEINLNKKLVAAKMKLSKYKNKVKRQAAAMKIAKNIIKNPSTLKALEGLPKSARIFTMLQLREVKKKSKGRRFTYDEKIVALSLLKQSPKGYRFLRKMFILPSPQTLLKLIASANIQPGINKNIVSQLKKQAQKMKPSHKLCILLFDEMALKTSITYNERLDKVIGFVNDGEKIQKEFADHAQVFMIRGLLKNYKQPIGYSFSTSATKGPELAKQIKLFVREIAKAGLTVVASVCDQGAGNRHAIKCLIDESRAVWLRRGEEPKNNIILVDDTEIVPLYDAPHLIKCIRNNLLAKDLKYTTQNQTRVAKWSHIECLYNKCPAFEGVRLLPKLTDNHVKPAKIVA